MNSPKRWGPGAMIENLFWDVDTQHDFMDADGALPVPDAEAIVANLRRLTRFAASAGIPVIASADAHSPDDPEFEEFGPHCVAGTPGQAKIDATAPERSQVAAEDRLEAQAEQLAAGELAQLVIEKQDLDVFTEPATDDLLDLLQPRRVYVYGVATEYCVLRTVRGLRKRGYATSVIADAVKAIEPEQGRKALAEMRELGAAMAEASEALEALAGGAE